VPQDALLQTALRERDALKAQLAKIRKRIAALDALIATYDEPSETPPFEAPECGIQPEPRLKKPGHPLEKKYDKVEIAAQARAAILELQRPMQRAQLLEALERRGIRIDGRNKPRNLGTIMWRLREQFVNIEGGYWPIDVACPSVGYRPAER
jgi:hypothetical protein